MAEVSAEGSDSSASEDSFDEVTPEEAAAMDEAQKAEYARRKRLSQVRLFKELSEEGLAALDDAGREAYEELKAEAESSETTSQSKSFGDVRDRMRAEAAKEEQINPWLNAASYLAKKAGERIFSR